MQHRHHQQGAARVGCLIAAGVAVVLALIAGAVLVSPYNALVGLDERVGAQWAEMDNQYRRRADLVPQLVATVRGAADFERGTLEAVTEARASVARVQLPSELPSDPAAIQAYLQAQQGLGAALSRLFAVSERYPELRASQNFLALQDQIEGTENRIAVARRDFIDAVRDYNTRLRRFPTNLVGGLLGFDARPQLDIDPADRETPEVDFDFGDGS